MASWETLVEGASMTPPVLTPIQSGQGLPDCVDNARLVFARTFSLVEAPQLNSSPSVNSRYVVKQDFSANWPHHFLLSPNVRKCSLLFGYEHIV